MRYKARFKEIKHLSIDWKYGHEIYTFINSLKPWSSFINLLRLLLLNLGYTLESPVASEPLTDGPSLRDFDVLVLGVAIL